MATPPVFSAGAVLTAAQMNAVGMWLVKTDTVTSGSSKTITNAFTDDFDNYRIVVTDVCLSADQDLMFRFGTDNTGYYGSKYYDNSNGASTGTARMSNGASLYTGFGSTLTGNSGMSFDVFGPRSTYAHKGIHGTFWGGGYSGWFAGVRATSSQYTSFTLLTLSGATFSNGKIYVYGYRQ